MGRILVVDDEQRICALLARMMELEGYEVQKAYDCQNAKKLLEQYHSDVVLCDVFLPDGNGVDLIFDMKKISPGSEIIMLTAHGNIPDGVQAIKNGAFDYITKGDDNYKIIPIVNRAMEQAERNRGKEEAKFTGYTFDSIIGGSGCLSSAVTLAKKVARTDVPILLTGETGTGKEVFAHAIHEASHRHEKPLVSINCSAFSNDLFESELFGHKAGSFTGALKDKKGLFEVADKGTLFLDEIGEMSFALQAKLLRVLETGEYIKIGDTKPTKVDVRIISATNRDLKHEIEKGNFREDLFFRLSVFQIELPPLRDRKGDVELLAKTFINRFAKQLGKHIDGMTPEFLNILKCAEWKGNIRELKNVMERSAIVCEGKLTVEDLPIELQQLSSADSKYTDEFELSTIERKHIFKVLQYTKGNKTEAARLLKIGLATLYRKIETYQITI